LIEQDFKVWASFDSRTEDRVEWQDDFEKAAATVKVPGQK
jgi:hypothetical protein